MGQIWAPMARGAWFDRQLAPYRSLAGQVRWLVPILRWGDFVLLFGNMPAEPTFGATVTAIADVAF